MTVPDLNRLKYSHYPASLLSIFCKIRMRRGIVQEIRVLEFVAVLPLGSHLGRI